MKRKPPTRPKGFPELFSKIFNFFGNPVFVKNHEHRFIYVNDAFCSFYSIRKQDIVGKKDEELFPRREWKVYREIDKKIFGTGMPYENDEYSTVPGGGRMHVRTKKSLLQTPDGEKYVLGIITDITEKTNLLKKIKESEKKYKAIFDLGSDPSALFSYPELTAVDVNASFLKLSKLKRSSVIGKQASHILSWVDLHEKEIYYNSLLNGHRVDNMEIHLKLLDGAVIPFLISARMLDIDKKSYILFSLRDTSNLKWTEKSLLESELAHRVLFNNIPDLVLIHYCGVIVFINRAVVDFFDRPKELIIGHRLADLFRGRDTYEGGKNLNQPAIDSMLKHLTAEIEIMSHEGKKIHFLTRSLPIKYKGNDSIMSILNDITEQKNLETLILSKIIETEENERKRFAADLHDGLGPILSSIRLHLGIAQKDIDPVKLEDTLEICEHLLDEVMQRVHSISHSITPHLIEDFGLEAGVTDLIHMITNNQNFIIVFNSNLRNTRFPSDVELHYFRIISELINNSIKHSSVKKMVINLKLHKGNLSLIYYDDGPGYDISDITRHSIGMGIKNIIQRVSLMKGNIEFNQVNRRTRVVINTQISL